MTPLRPFLHQGLVVLCLLIAWAAPAVAADWLEWRPIQGPCNGDCGVAGYFGWYVEEGMSDVFISSPETPLTWTYAGDHLLAGAVTRRIATLWSHVDVEPEFGVGQRMGKQHETEILGRGVLSLARLSLGRPADHHRRDLDRDELRHRHLG